MPYSEIAELSQVIQIDETKCVNCHACISACPVKYCNNGSKEYVTLNSQLCIGCGNCVDACTHKARYFTDDFKVFRDSLINNEKVIVLLSPAVAANFEGKILQLNGFFLKLGADAVFDVSFGAELSAKSYIEYIKKNNPQTVITQPCPALVTNIEIYHPELLPFLAPVQSPVGHTVELIRNYYPKYKNHKIAFISPCIAKKREFDETGHIDFNVGITSIANFMEVNQILLSEMPEVDFSNPAAERAVMFSTPGGLLETVKRTLPDIGNSTRKIEGIPLVYNYFANLNKSVEKKTSPLLIDCLSCENGCNGGPLTKMRHENADEIEYHVKKRTEEHKNLYELKSEYTKKSESAIEKIISDFWNEELYSRKYIDRSSTLTIKTPNDSELQNIFNSMYKFKEEDIKNCTSCGYNSCEGMAKAIFNGLNRPQNCHFYLEKETEISHEETRKSKFRLSKMLETTPVGFIEVDNDEVLIDCNPRMSEILKTNDILGKKLFEFIDDDYIQILHQQLKHRQDGIKSNYELVLKQADGGKVFCSVHASPLYDSQKNKTGSFAMLADITQLKKTEESLREMNEELENRVLERTHRLSEANEELRVNAETLENSNKELEKLSVAISQIENSIVIFNNSGEIEWTNNKFIKNYHFVSAFSKDSNIKDFETFSDIEEILEKISKTQKPYTFSKKEKYSKTTDYFIQTTITPIIDDYGKIKKYVAVGADITELKMAQEAISQQNEEIKQQREELITQRDALTESEDKINNILESLPDAAFVINESGIVTFWNKAIEKMTGISVQEIIGKGNYEYALPFYGEKRMILIDLVNIDSSILEQKYSHIAHEGKIMQAETYVPNLKGESRYLSATASPLYSSSGEYIGAVEIIHDITQTKHFIEEIEQQKKELVEQSVKMAEMIEELNVTNSIIESINQELEQLSIVASETENSVLIMDSEGKVEWGNRAFAKIYGNSFEKLTAEKGNNICNLSDNPNINQDLEKVIQTKTSVTYTNQSTKPDETKIYVQTTLSPVLSPEGEIKKLVAVGTDISELKIAQEAISKQNEEIKQQREELITQRDALADSEDKINNILQSLPDAAFVINENGIITFWNKAIEEMTGFSASLMIGKGEYEYAMPFYGEKRMILIDLVNIDSTILEQKYSNITRQGKILQAETYVPNLKGEARYLSATASALLSSDGEYIGAVEIIHDVTQRKHFIEEIELQKKELIEQSVRMSEMIEELNVTNSIIESVNQELEQLSIVASETENAVVIMNPEGKAEWVNRAFTKIYGRSLEELIAEKGDNICDFSDNETICQDLEKVKNTKTSVTYSNQTTKPNGTKIYVQTSLSPVVSPEREIIKLVAVEADITKLQEAQEKILIQKNEIQKQKEEVEKQSKDIVDSIHYAGRIQKALLLPESTILNILPEHFILFLPRDIVSGDFYWLHQINTKIIIAAADCTGHGVPGAFMSMLGISYLNEIIIKNKITQPDIVLDNLRFSVKKALHQTGQHDESQDGMDIALAVFDTETKTYEFSGAYNPILQIRNQEIIIFKGDKMPIGIHRRDSEKFTSAQGEFSENDVFYIFSDGFPDQIGQETGRKYLHKNFNDFLLKIHEKPMQHQKEELLNEFTNWRNGYFQVDDVLVFGFKIT